VRTFVFEFDGEGVVCLVGDLLVLIERFFSEWSGRNSLDFFLDSRAMLEDDSEATDA